MTRLRVLTILILTVLFLGPTLGPAISRAEEPPPLTFGVLPVVQALPLFVAEEMGLFKAEGVAVQLIPFRTAMEKEVAMSTGRLDGYFGDLFTPIVLRANGVDLRIAARNFISGQGRRMFAVLGSPKSEARSAADLAGVPVAVSTKTIIEYVTATLLEQAGVPADRIEMLEVKNIPVRLQMLLSGQVQAATLPEPLVTLAEKQGCRVLAQDDQSELSSTVLVFSRETLETRGSDVQSFMTAVHHAVEAVNSGLEAVRPIMNQTCNVPPPLRDSFPTPFFPPLAAPDRARVEAAGAWLVKQGVIAAAPSYDDLVNDEFVR